MYSKAISILFASVLSASAIAQYGYGDQGWGHEDPQYEGGVTLVPGTINYVEGDVTLNGKALAIRSGNTTAVKPGEFLQTGKGRAELLLASGIFLRLDRNSALTMVLPDPKHTEVELDRGRAEVEVDRISADDYTLIDQKSGGTQLLKRGLYEFDANNNTLRVYDGEAAVFAGDGTHSAKDEKPVTVKGGRELTVADPLGKPKEFDRDANQADDSLYRWSSLRSQSLAESSYRLEPEGDYAGWAWSPGLYGYTWLPGDGYAWYPYGLGFYSPYAFYGGGYFFGRGYGYGYGRGYGYRGGFGRGGFAGRAGGGFRGGGHR
jgi:hypothetical protein